MVIAPIDCCGSDSLSQPGARDADGSLSTIKSPTPADLCPPLGEKFESRAVLMEGTLPSFRSGRAASRYETSSDAPYFSQRKASCSHTDLSRSHPAAVVFCREAPLSGNAR